MLYSDYYKNKATNNGTPINAKFIKWIDKIEFYFIRFHNINLLDIPDESYMNYFENNWDPIKVIELVETNNQFELGLSMGI